MVISLSDAGAQPNAMVVEFEHTIVTNVAVRSSRGSKNLANFTIFKFEKAIALRIYTVIKYFVRRIDFPIFFCKFWFGA